MIKPTKKEIEQYRQAVIEELKHLDVDSSIVNIDEEIQIMLEKSDNAITNYMEFNTPLECAEMFCM